MKGGHTKTGAQQLAWEMFQKTGSIAYYMLYHDLKHEKKE